MSGSGVHMSPPGGGLSLARLLCGSSLLMLLLAGCGGGSSVEKPPWKVLSPDGRVELIVDRSPGRLSRLADFCFEVSRDGIVFIESSPLGIEYEDADFTTGLIPVSTTLRDVSDPYNMFCGKRLERSLEARILTLCLENEEGKALEIDFAVAADGIAFRYRRPGDGQAVVAREVSGFAIPEGAVGWIQPYDRFIGSWPAYERTYNRVPAGADSSTDGMEFLDDGWSFPALFRIPEPKRYLLLSEAGLDENYAASRFEQQVEERLYRLRLPSEEEGNGTGEVRPAAALPWETAWRVAILGDLGTVVESTLVDDLSPDPERPLDYFEEWVEPGRVAWSWRSQGTGDAALQREYIDFAGEYSWEYVLIDAGWDQWDQAESLMPQLADYARARGVGILLWYNSGGPHNTMSAATPRDRMHQPGVRRAELEKIAGWGVRGIKVDFFASDKQDRIGQYLGILRDAADNRLMVNFHGCTLPRGWQRTWPNLMSHEAVYGAENYNISDGPSSLHNVRLVFNRNVVGSMDYTPVNFKAALDARGITYAHQLALAVVFESGLVHFADRADSEEGAGYRKVFGVYPRVAAFLSEVPVAWDETRYVAGDPDTLAVLARRKAMTWYIAGISGPLEETANISLPLGELCLGSGRDYTLFESGQAADELDIVEGQADTGKDFNLSLGPRDGFVMVIDCG